VGQTSRESIVDELLDRFGRIPSIFKPALTSDERLHTLWRPLHRLYTDDRLPTTFLHRLLALHHQQNGSSYGVIWHLVALAKQGLDPAKFSELIELSAAPVAALHQCGGLLDELEAQGLPWTGHGPTPPITRALLALSLASTQTTTIASTHRRRLGRIFGAERYALWVEAIMHVHAWAAWLRSYPEIDADDETPLAEGFAALCSQVPGLERFAAKADKETADSAPKRWRVDADSVHTGILQADLNGQLLLTNTEARRIYRDSADLLNEFNLYDFEGVVFREDGSACPIEDFAAIRCLETGTSQGPQLLSHRGPDGTLTWATYTASPLLDPQTREAVGITVIVVDSTVHKLERAARQATEDRYRLLAQASEGMILLFDTQGAIITANDAAAAFIGANADSLTGKTLYELIPDTGLIDAFLARNRRVVETGEAFDREERIERGGDCRWVSTRLRPLRDRSGIIYAVQALIRDITPRREAELALREREEQARHASLHDPLTHQPNRVLLRDRLEVEVLHAKRHPGYQFAVLCLDLDRFKNINDSLGHSIGDELLVQFSLRLLETIGPEDTLARTGGDEFAILVKDLGDPSEALRLAERVLDILQRPFSVGGHQIYTPTSIGIALSSADSTRPEDILRDADTAMFRAKNRGKNRFEIFDQKMHREAVELLALENDLRGAITRQEFCLYYQPVIELASGELSGFEALVRWQHPTRGLVSPGDFISIAEETGIIIEIGAWVLQESMRRMQHWHIRYPTTPQLTISVNLSGKQFAQPALIATALRETALNPATLKLEITESVIMEDPRAASMLLKELQSQQIQSYVDDFGTGYSSLSYLHRFPMSAVKIDRSFISGIGPSGENAEIVRTIVNLAHNLGMKVIAEGVETDDQRQLLIGMGCEYAQGFFFSQPLKESDAEALIATTFEDRRSDV